MAASVLLTVRLASRNLRHKPGSALLLLLALCAATITLSLALAVRATGSGAWDRTFSVTRGADIVAASESPRKLIPLLHAASVSAATGPLPFLIANGRSRGRGAPMMLIGRKTLKGSVDQPFITAGSANLSGPGVVVEGALAAALGVGVKGTLEIDGAQLDVRGIGLSVAQPRLANGPGVGWVSTSTLRRLTGRRGPRAYVVELRLRIPQTAPAFSARYAPPSVQSQRGGLYVTTWQNLRQLSLADVRTIQTVLLTLSALLVALSTASGAALVASRMTSRIRQVGTLKAVGVTPAQITAVVIVEYLVMAIIAAGVGLLVGSSVAPLRVRPAAGLLASTTVPFLTWERAGAVMLLGVLMTLLAATGPAWNGARHSTLRSLGASEKPPARAAGLARIAAALRLPVPIVLGVLSSIRRPARTALTTVSFALSVATAAAALASQRSFNLSYTTSAAPASSQRLLALVYVCTAVFLLLGFANTVIMAAFAARDSARNQAALRAIGFTRAQGIASLVSAQSLTAIIAIAVGMPLGLTIFRLTYGAANGGSEGAHTPPISWLAILALVAIALWALAAAVPAYISSRRPVVPLLIAE